MIKVRQDLKQSIINKPNELCLITNIRHQKVEYIVSSN